MAKQFLKYQWFVTYLFAASPLVAPDLYPTQPSEAVRSLRASQTYGYSNNKAVQISFASLEDYVADMEKALASRYNQPRPSPVERRPHQKGTDRDSPKLAPLRT
ncbi:hypothetical protein ACVRZD_05175 [Streptococcus hongkongensis]